MATTRKTNRKPTSSRARKRRLAQKQANALNFQTLEDRRMLAVITVDSLADNFVLDGNITLREAVQAANTDSSVDGSVAGSGADTINFSTALSGQTITLAGLELEITEALRIDATALANDVTINANEMSRIFNITTTTGDFQFNGLTLTGGKTTGDNVSSNTTYSGGAIRSLTTGNLTLDGSTITGNSTAGSGANGGGVFARGNVTLTGSTVSGNSTAGLYASGGGVYAGGYLTLTNSTVSGNSTAGRVAYGGGVFAPGNVTLTGSTVSGNSTAGYNSHGGGVYARGNVTLTGSTVSGNSTAGTYADGGGVDAFGNVTLTGSTVSGNSTAGDYASGGGVYANGNVALTGSTVSGNSTAGELADAGGVHAGGDVTLSLSTVTNNRATHATSTGGGIWNNDDTILIDGSIVAGNFAGGGMNDIDPGTGTFTVNFSLLGTGVSPDAGGSGNVFNDTPLVGALQDNGGPTETHAILAGSPAIDAGSPLVTTLYDQRGEPFTRIIGGRVDIGAYERQSVAGLNLKVDNVIDENDGDFSAGDLSLREAIGLANASSGHDTISFATALSGQAITLVGAELEITEAVIIDAIALATNVTIDANDNFRIFNITATTGDFQFNGLTLTGGITEDNNVDGFDNTYSGGAIRSLTTGNLTFDGSTITGNSTAGTYASGSGVFARGNVTLTGSTVSGNNTAGGRAFGGGVSAGGNVTLTGSTVSGNGTAGIEASGGGVFAGGNVTLTGSTVSGNSTGGNSADGGGVRAGGNVTLTNSTVSGNITEGSGADGGGVFALGDVTLSLSTVVNNEATSTGGGIWNNNDTILIDGSIVAGNLAAGGMNDIDPGSGTISVNYSLIGSGVTPDAGTSGNNVVANNPMIGALANNGGQTQTHELLAGSPAIDVGDPSLVSPPDFDQRGAPFVRVVGGRVDIGAFELQSSAAAPTVTGVVRDGGGVLDRPDLLNTFLITFDQDVNVSAANLIVNNDTLGSVVDTSSVGFSYDAGNLTATWDFSSLVLDAAFYSFELSASITGVVGGLALDGDNDGTAGDSYVESVYVAIPGDANLDGQVNVLGDAFLLVGNLGTTGGATWAQGDFNGDGNVNVLGDAFPLVGNLGQDVRPPMMAATSNTSNLNRVAILSTDDSSEADEQDAATTGNGSTTPASEPPQLVLAGDHELRDDVFGSDF